MGFFDPGGRTASQAAGWQREAVSSPSNVRSLYFIETLYHGSHTTDAILAMYKAKKQSFLAMDTTSVPSSTSGNSATNQASISFQAHAKTNLVYLAPSDEASKVTYIEISGM